MPEKNLAPHRQTIFAIPRGGCSVPDAPEEIVSTSGAVEARLVQGKYYLTFPYSAEAVSVVRQMNGFHFDRFDRCWVAPAHRFETVARVVEMIEATRVPQASAGRDMAPGL